MTDPKVQIATNAETSFFTGDNPEVHEKVAQIVRRWEKLVDPEATYFMPVEIEPDDHGGSSRVLYMEPPRTHESWLDGIVVAFRTLGELESYIEWICRHKYKDETSFSYWHATLKTIHESLPRLTQEWLAAGHAGSLRVELHQVTQSGSIEFVEEIWDNSTT